MFRNVSNQAIAHHFLGIHLRMIRLSNKDRSTDIPSDADITIFSDPTSLGLLSDAEMDYIDDPFRPTFHFTPPTGSSSCGCGSSFQID